MIKVSDKLQSTAVDGMVVDSEETEYHDLKGRFFMSGVGDVKTAIDTILDQLFPVTNWSVQEAIYETIATSATALYYGKIETYSGNIELKRYKVTLEKGNTDSYVVEKVYITSKTTGEFVVELSKGEGETYTGSLYLKNLTGKDSYAHDYSNPAETIKKEFNLIVRTRIGEEIANIEYPLGETAYTFPAGNYNDPGSWSSKMTFESTGTEFYLGEKPDITLSWKVENLIKYDDTAEVTYTPAVTLEAGIKSGTTWTSKESLSTEKSGTKIVNPTSGITYRLNTTTDTGEDIKGLTPKVSAKYISISFSTPDLYFWSKDPNITETVASGSGVKLYVDKGSYEPKDKTGWYLYLLTTTGSGVKFQFKASTADDAYYTVGAKIVSSGNRTVIKAGSWNISKKEQAVDVEGKYYIYRSENNITIKQTIKKS